MRDRPCAPIAIRFRIRPPAVRPKSRPYAMQVLVADDNPVFQRILQGMLSKWGYQVVVRADGRAAWQHLSSDHGSRLAILDWEMPGMDGVEICRRLRAEILDRYIYVLLVSSRAEGYDVIQGMNSG